MDVFEAVETRRSIKHYDPEHRMTEAEVQKLMSATILSPTSFNIQHWRFVLVQNPELRQEVYKAAWHQAQIVDSSLLVVVTGDLEAWDKQPERYWQNADTNTQDIMVPFISKCYDGQEQLKRDEVMRSCGIAAQTLMLVAKDMGYDTCPMVGFDPAQVAEIIHLPEDHIITMIITVGKALKPARPRGGQLPLDEVVMIDHF